MKVLDFGLAKALDVETGEAALSNSPTLLASMPGVILGTAAYMSPEQARGKVVDEQTDIWAFGCVLFEMLTGKRAFTGDTVSDVVAGILKTEPEWGALPAATPAAIRRLLARVSRRIRASACTTSRMQGSTSTKLSAEPQWRSTERRLVAASA